ncbi:MULTISPECIES: HlyD family secretion protein [Rhizobium]|uniref:HlyD family secretion protein n=1 Tax=Rhizobium TaxID=379 RepID=UPI0005656170|nr:HlyD family secretion protein [Rhizobium lusitanum]NTJ09732.1 HlyD family secretion protein [Rhizobium lusitanum]
MTDQTTTGTGSSAALAPSPVLATIKRVAIPALAVVVIACAVTSTMLDWNSWVAGASRQTTDDAIVNADISTLSAQISGTISSMPVADYQRVTKGQLLAQIDPRSYEAAVAVSTANLASANATLANLANQIELQKAAIDAAEAQHTSALAQQTQTVEEYQRQSDLGGATTQQALQQAQAAALQATASVRSTAAAIAQQQAQLKVLQGQEPLLRAQVDAAKGNLDTAKINEGYTRIYAPFDGMLGRKLVHEGDFVSAGAGILAEVPLPNVYITANFKETQLSRMSAGNKVEIRIDTFPGELLRGTVIDLSPASGSIFALLPPDNATGNYTKVVQRLPVKIAIDGGQSLMDRLRPGMSATVTVETPDSARP